MIIEVSPNANVVLDGSGNGQVPLGPPSATKWALRLATLSVTTSVKQPQGFLYRGSSSGPQELIDSTYTGAQASSSKVGGALFYSGQVLWAVWKGGDAGATATLQVYGQQGTRSDPLPLSPPGEGFANPVVAGTALIIPAINSPNFVHGSTGWSINRDGTAEFSSATIRGDVIAGPAGNAIELLHTIPAEIVTFYTARSETVNAIQIFQDSTGRYEYLANLLGGFLAIGAVDASHNVQEIAFLGAQSPAAAFGIGEASAVQFYISSQGSASSQFLSDIPLFFSVNGTPEVWHGFSFQNGFGNRGAGFMAGSYRKVASPANSVEIKGQIVSGATVASGTVITNLPSGYRPITEQTFICQNNSTFVTMLLAVETTGDVKLFGTWANGHVIMINGFIALDL